MSEQNNGKRKRDITSKISYSTLSSENQITVPSVIREKLNAKPGDQVVFNYDEETNEITVTNIKKDSLLSLYGSMPPRGEKSQKEWNAIRQEARNEMYIRKESETIKGDE